MSSVFETLQGHQFINLTTYRRNGQPVITTVWFAQDGDRIIGTTLQQSGKIKRIKHTPRVDVAPSTFDGRVLGESVEGVARVLLLDEFEAARTALRMKYGAQYDQAASNNNPGAVRVFWEVKLAT